MDRRDQEQFRSKWYDRFDQKAMTADVELHDEDSDVRTVVKVPFHYEVCDLCGGKGKHVNPSIDAHGIGQEEFEVDPDFQKDYTTGVYDVSCYRCAGLRLVPVANLERLPKDVRAKVADHIADKNEPDHEAMSEARYFGYV